MSSILEGINKKNPVAKAAQKIAKGSGKHKNPAKTIPRKQKYKNMAEGLDNHNLASTIEKVKKITSTIKNATMADDIISEIHRLAAENGIDMRELEYLEDKIYQAKHQLESAILSLDRPFIEAYENMSDEDELYENEEESERLLKHIKNAKKYTKPKEVDEDLGPEQKKDGQLGPTTKIGKRGTTGYLVGANEGKNFDSIQENGIISGIIQSINEKKDACYHKVKSRYKVWPSAYASGALVKCRKKGANNWGNKSK